MRELIESSLRSHTCASPRRCRTHAPPPWRWRPESRRLPPLRRQSSWHGNGGSAADAQHLCASWWAASAGAAAPSARRDHRPLVVTALPRLRLRGSLRPPGARPRPAGEWWWACPPAATPRTACGSGGAREGGPGPSRLLGGRAALARTGRRGAARSQRRHRAHPGAHITLLQRPVRADRSRGRDALSLLDRLAGCGWRSWATSCSTTTPGGNVARISPDAPSPWWTFAGGPACLEGGERGAQRRRG